MNRARPYSLMIERRAARERARDRAGHIFAAVVFAAIAALFGGLGLALVLQPVDPYGAPVAVQATAAGFAFALAWLGTIGAGLCVWYARP